MFVVTCRTCGAVGHVSKVNISTQRNVTTGITAGPRCACAVPAVRVAGRRSASPAGHPAS